MNITSLRVALIALVLVSSAACGSSGSSSPTSPSSTASGSGAASASTLNLAGTWSGTMRDPTTNEPIRISSWTATQSGAAVSGPLIVVVDADEDGIVNVPSTFTGTVTSSQITAATFRVAAGAIPDPTLAACSFSGTGNLTATATSISGSLAMTFPPACVGRELVSETPTATWTISLTK
jgi:hypothetical protein